MISFFSLGIFTWLTLEIKNREWYAKYATYIFSVFFYFAACSLLAGIIALNKIIKNHFSENDARQRKYMHVFLLITIIAVVESLFYFAYSPIVSNKIINLYPRFIIENFSNLLWDVPVIIIMTVSHY